MYNTTITFKNGEKMSLRFESKEKLINFINNTKDSIDTIVDVSNADTLYSDGVATVKEELPIEPKVSVVRFSVDWLEIKNACRATISKGDSHVEPNEEWKKKLLIARHSPLRLGTVLVRIEDIPFYVMGHLVRHSIGCTPFVGTSREDRTGISRNERRQTDLVSMEMVFNIESLLNVSAKRLCQQADKTTIKVWKMILDAIREYDKDIYWACVPNGIHQGGCPECFGDCHMCESYLNKMSPETRMDMIARYDAYNQMRDKGARK